VTRKYFPEHLYYFALFTVVSILYIVNGYAMLGTNDDWALRGLLHAKGVYGTLIMSYPLSYVMSHLYDLSPAFPWYSTLLSLLMALNFYMFARYIAQNDTLLQKIILLILALLWMTFLWFNLTITALTITTIITAVGLIRRDMTLSMIFLIIASLLRTEMMLIFMPYYLVSFFILREHFTFSRKEFVGMLLVVVAVVFSVWMQKQDRPYSEWLKFNKARAAIVDMGILDVDEGYFSKTERFCITAGWWQDPELLATEKVLATTPTLKRILERNINQIHLVPFIQHYKFKEWLWLLLAASVLVMVLNLKNRRLIFMPMLVAGVVLLLITRDVERVTVPLIMLWAYVVFESLRRYRAVSTILLLLFTLLFYHYASGQLGYRYFKENSALQQEARQLIDRSGKVCETSIHFPTRYSPDLSRVFQANYLFRENSWLQMNDREILPGGWLVRHPYFYEAHHLSDKVTKRVYPVYHDFLIDDKTAFFGAKGLIRNNKGFNILLHAYDERYLKEKPGCRHETYLVDESDHFAISQIRIVCRDEKTK